MLWLFPKNMKCPQKTNTLPSTEQVEGSERAYIKYQSSPGCVSTLLSLDILTNSHFAPQSISCSQPISPSSSQFRQSTQPFSKPVINAREPRRFLDYSQSNTHAPISRSSYRYVHVVPPAHLIAIISFQRPILLAKILNRVPS